MVFAPLFDLTAGDGNADEVRIGGDGLGMDFLKPLSAVERISWYSFRYKKKKRMYFRCGSFVNFNIPLGHILLQ